MDEPAWIKRLEDRGVLRDELASLGWAFWPFGDDGLGMGYFDPQLLRQLADVIEARNKPFWDAYDKHCLEHQDEMGLLTEEEFHEFEEAMATG